MLQKHSTFFNQRLL